MQYYSRYKMNSDTNTTSYSSTQDESICICNKSDVNR